MRKFKLPVNKYFFVNAYNPMLYKFAKNLYQLHNKDLFGYVAIISELHKKKLKFIKKTFNPFFNLNPNKNYAIFINYNLKSHILLNQRLITKNTLLFLENFVDNGIYIYEIT